MSSSAASPASSRMVFMLAAVVALGPLSVDLYLPAMPAMVEFFGTELDRVQLTLSGYLFGFALFHLVCGPLSDRFGRKPVLLAGLAVYVVMSAACAMATTIEQLIVLRFFQAMGACCAPTLGRAMVRDLFPPDQAVKALAYVSSLMALAPVVAPSLGGLLVVYGDWSLTFWVLVGAGLLAMGLVAFCIPESLPEKQSLHPASILHNYATLLRDRHYMGNVMTAAFLYSGAFAFLSGASFVLIDFLGVKANHFGLYFVFIVVGYIGGNLFTARIGHHWQPAALYRLGIGIACVSSFVMVVVCLLQWRQPIWIVLPVLGVTLAIGIVLPQAMGEALKPFPHMAATASALMGFLQMSIAATVGWLVGFLLEGNPLPMALIIFATAVSSLLSYWFYLPRKNRACAVELNRAK